MSQDSNTLGEIGVIDKKKEELCEPSMYKVLLHNDHYTTMEFVVEILIKVFHFSMEKAEQKMLQVHHNGYAVCGIFTFEIAESKVDKVHCEAEKNNCPLKSSYEPV